MNSLIDQIFNLLTERMQNLPLLVVIIAMIPVMEARLAVPFALRSGFSPLKAWLFSFLGSSAVAPVVLLLLLPIINLISRIKLFKSASGVVMQRFNKKAQSVDGGEIKSLFGVFMFACLPLPLTGVYTSSAIAAVLKLNFFKALAAILCGNLVACGILTLLCSYFAAYLNTIILVITLFAILAVVALIIKTVFSKRYERTADC